MIDSLSKEELDLIKAIEEYKKETHKHFLSWSEVLKVLKRLGYRRPGTPRERNKNVS